MRTIIRFTRWHLIACFFLLVIVGIAFRAFRSREPSFREKYEMLEMDMTKEEVFAILGPPTHKWDWESRRDPCYNGLWVDGDKSINLAFVFPDEARKCDHWKVLLKYKHFEDGEGWQDKFWRKVKSLFGVSHRSHPDAGATQLLCLHRNSGDFWNCDAKPFKAQKKKVHDLIRISTRPLGGWGIGQASSGSSSSCSSSTSM